VIIKGRVIRIFDDEKVAINLGSQQGSEEGKKVWFFAPATEIQDPENQEKLGEYRYLKATGRVISVAKRFSIVGAYPREEETVPMAAQFNLWGSWRAPTVKKRVPGQLPVSDVEAIPVPGGSDISVGDAVEISVDDSSNVAGANEDPDRPPVD
jgi:hypothetical protein